MADATVHVIDDDAALRDSLAFLLGSAGLLVRSFESAQAFLQELASIEAGCVVTDIRMPGIDGLELLRLLQEMGKGLPVIVMTGHGDVPLAVKAMRLGAADFVEKPFEDEVMIDAVRSALTSSMPLPPAGISDEMALRIASLSRRERQVLSGLVEGQTNKEIARQFDLSPRTVEVYRAKLMTKMQANNISELVRFAMRAGVTGG
ncbi:response regulator FixJ [Methylovirgula sp. HY1]|jgi:two-component system response regulator FixJ|uniref:response regulator FixJ n=1 Tax=Methylovirgula sp. HY1 TaxID=2822761 RepID=UPI001C5B2C2C|nr:response regulator FixJ [Methylovirgula sp. HY1]QXX76447.1 Transcriptional regulatory protein FixJ [Methylovirgula sp. HY1]